MEEVYDVLLQHHLVADDVAETRPSSHYAMQDSNSREERKRGDEQASIDRPGSSHSRCITPNRPKSGTPPTITRRLSATSPLSTRPVAAWAS